MTSLFAMLISTTLITTQMCFYKDDLEQHIYQNFNEELKVSGLAANGQLLKVYTSPDGSSWTLTLSLPNGIHCIMATGEAWGTMTSAKTSDPGT